MLAIAPAVAAGVRRDLRARALPVRRRRHRERRRPPRRRATRTSAIDPVDVPLDVILGKPPKMTRDVRARSRGAAAARSGGRSTLKDAALSRAAAARGRRQDVPGHDRRSHRGRAVRARPDGRSVAGAGRRRRGHADGLRGLRRRGDGDRRAHAARADRRAGVGTHGGGRGDHQSRRRRHRAHRRRQALGELDGAGGPSRRRRRALRHRARGRARHLHSPRRCDPGRQGLDVDAHDVARRRAATMR